MKLPTIKEVVDKTGIFSKNSRQSITHQQLVWLAFHTGVEHGFAHHDDFVSKLGTCFGLDMHHEITREGLGELLKIIEENFDVVDVVVK